MFTPSALNGRKYGKCFVGMSLLLLIGSSTDAGAAPAPAPAAAPAIAPAPLLVAVAVLAATDAAFPAALKVVADDAPGATPNPAPPTPTADALLTAKDADLRTAPAATLAAMGTLRGASANALFVLMGRGAKQEQEQEWGEKEQGPPKRRLESERENETETKREAASVRE